MATALFFFRMVNNSDCLTDFVVRGGIGILMTKTAYCLSLCNEICFYIKRI